MKYKLYGHPNKIVIHGGPGAPGSVSSLARDLDDCIEIYNYGQTIKAQLQEIHEIVEVFKMNTPVLIAHSWGAWLAFLYAAKHPTSKIVLIGCGAFKESYLDLMNQRRQQKLTSDELTDVDVFFSKIAKNEEIDMSYFGRLMAKMDSYELRHYDDELLFFDVKGYQMLMDEFRILRKSGALLEMYKTIHAEVVVIHGKDDPHPYEGILEPFNEVGLKYRVHLINRCGHAPWCEKYARDEFYQIIKEEMKYLFQSDRLGFRNLSIDDKTVFRQMNANPEVMKYFPNTLDETASDAFLSRIINNYERDDFGLYGVELIKTGKLLGFIGLSRPSFKKEFVPCIEIGWRLEQKYWRQGYAKEGALRVLNYGFEVLKLTEIVSFTALINTPSIAVMKSIGLNYVKNFEHPSVEGPLKDHVLYKIERSS